MKKSEEIIEQAKQRFKELEHKQFEWRSFYNGYLEGQVKQLIITDVSQQRELLKAFKEWEANKCKLPWDANIDEVVEQYIAINCG